LLVATMLLSDAVVPSVAMVSLFFEERQENTWQEEKDEGQLSVQFKAY